MAPTLAELLQQANALLAKSPAQALSKLLAAWRIAPTTETAGLVSAFEAAHPQPPFDGDTAAFVRAAAAAGELEKSALLQRVRGKKMSDTHARFTAAIAWGPDPRTSQALAAMVTELPYTSDSAKGLWITLFGGVTAMKDPRFSTLAKTAPPTWGVRENIRGWLTHQLARAAGELAAPALDRDELAAIAALRATLEALAPQRPPSTSERDEASLLADVYAHPDDDAPRLVYADWLQERGDPRGEFITLQFQTDKDAAALRREKALLKAHGKAWLGRLQPVVQSDYEFRRGFVAKASLKFKHDAQRNELGALPEWSTVEDLAPFGPLGPAMRRLKVLRGGDAAWFLPPGDPWPTLEELICVARDLDQLRAILATPLLPKLRRLELISRSIGDSGAWLDGVTTAPARELVLRVDCAPAKFANWVARAAALPIDTLVLSTGFRERTHWRFSRDDAGRLSRLALRPAPGATKLVDDVTRLPAGLLSRFELLGPPDAALIAAGEAKAKSALAPPAGGAATAEPATAEPATAKSATANPAEPVALSSPIAVAWHRDGWWFGERNRLVLVDATTRAIRRELPINPAKRIAFTDDGTRAVGLAYRSAHIYALSDGSSLAHVSAESKSPSDLKLCSDGRRALFGAEYNAYFYDLESQTLLRKQKAPIYYNGAVAPDGSRFALPLDDLLQIFDAKPKSRALKLGSGHGPCWLRDGRLGFFRDDALIICDPLNGDELMRVGGLASPKLLVASPTGKRVALFDDMQLAVIDLVSRARIWRRRLARTEYAVTFSPDGERLLVAGTPPLLLDAATGDDR